MIKKIHYVWLGGEEPAWVKHQVANWRKLCPDFEIIKWDESNIDLSGSKWAQVAFDEKKWAFVGDYVRLQVLKQHGGWYFDTDVEIYNSPKMIPVRDYDFILGYIGYCVLGTAVVYSSPEHHITSALLETYYNKLPGEYAANNGLFTDYFISNVKGFLLTGKEWQDESSHIYPKEMFEVGGLSHKHHMSLHRCRGSWIEANVSNSSNKLRFRLHTIMQYIKQIQFIRYIVTQYMSYRIDSKSKYWERYLKDSEIANNKK